MECDEIIKFKDINKILNKIEGSIKNNKVHKNKISFIKDFVS